MAYTRPPLPPAATQRMLRQATGPGTDLTTRYLRAFGITDVSLNRLPAIINPNYEPEWKAFLGANSELHGTPADKALRAVLSFVRYCQELKINAVSRERPFKDPLTSSTRININGIRLALVREKLGTVHGALQKYLLKMRLSQYLKVYRAKSATVRVGSDYNIVTVFALNERNPRLSLDAILANLSGHLYDGELPPQLAPMIRNKKDARPPFDTMLNGGMSVIGWYPILRSPAFSLFAFRAQKGFLMLKVIVPIGPISKDNGDIPLKDRLQIWSKFKLFQ